MNKRHIFFLTRIFLFAVLISFLVSCNKDFSKTQKTEIEKYRGPAEFKKYYSTIKRGVDEDSPNQYRSGYKEIELKKMEENLSKRTFLRSSANQKDEGSGAHSHGYVWGWRHVSTIRRSEKNTYLSIIVSPKIKTFIDCNLEILFFISLKDNFLLISFKYFFCLSVYMLKKLFSKLPEL